MRGSLAAAATALAFAAAAPSADTRCLADDSATDARTAWLKRTCVPLKSETDPGFEDLAPLAASIGDARVVALGEPTHGSREIFQMKRRFVEWLATERGFTVLAMEAGFPESSRVNDYVLTGRGDPVALVDELYWDSKEILELVEWMRAFNASGKGRLEFAGFNMEIPDAATTAVDQFVARADPAFADEQKRDYAIALSVPGWRDFNIATAWIDGKSAAGRRIRVTGWIRTQDVSKWAALWCRVDGQHGETVAMDLMPKSRPSGTTPWTAYEVALDVPDGATGVAFGAWHQGGGRAWFDGLRVELGGSAYDPGAAVDLGFDGETLLGFESDLRKDRRSVDPSSLVYRIATVTDAPHDGARCLLSERRPGTEVTTQGALDLVKRVRVHMEAARESYVAARGATDTDWALQNALVVEQWAEMRASRNPLFARDRSMAENVSRILARQPEAKMVLWAHNRHVLREPDWMGAHLAKALGPAYRPIGFATGTGRYRAIAGAQTAENDLAQPPPGSCEAALARTGIARLFLDLRKSDAADAASAWMRKPMPFREIGALATERQFVATDLPTCFDALVWIEKTTASAPVR